MLKGIWIELGISLCEIKYGVLLLFVQNIQRPLSESDVWMRKAEKADGTKYWEYVLLYVDDALCISENAETILRNEIGKYFQLKEAPIGPPSLYLDGHLSI